MAKPRSSRPVIELTAVSAAAAAQQPQQLRQLNDDAAHGLLAALAAVPRPESAPPALEVSSVSDGSEDAEESGGHCLLPQRAVRSEYHLAAHSAAGPAAPTAGRSNRGDSSREAGGGGGPQGGSGASGDSALLSDRWQLAARLAPWVGWPAWDSGRRGLALHAHGKRLPRSASARHPSDTCHIHACPATPTIIPPAGSHAGDGGGHARALPAALQRSRAAPEPAVAGRGVAEVRCCGCWMCGGCGGVGGRWHAEAAGLLVSLLALTLHSFLPLLFAPSQLQPGPAGPCCRGMRSWLGSVRPRVHMPPPAEQRTRSARAAARLPRTGGARSRPPAAPHPPLATLPPGARPVPHEPRLARRARRQLVSRAPAAPAGLLAGCCAARLALACCTLALRACTARLHCTALHACTALHCTLALHACTA